MPSGFAKYKRFASPGRGTGVYHVDDGQTRAGVARVLGHAE